MMSHTSDIESRSNPDGLQEIRSWASRSPDSARPGFRSRSRSGGFSRASSQRAASVLLGLLLLLLSLAGYRFVQAGKDTSDLATVPEPEPVAQVVDGNGEIPPAAEAAADIPQARKEPVQASATLPARPIPPKEPKAAFRAVVSRDGFESEPAVLLSTPAAEYPDAARGTGTTAEVIVGFIIDETGAVRDPAVENAIVQGSAPESLFVEEALAAARRARFEPARERGVPTRSWNTLTFSFETGTPPA